MFALWLHLKRNKDTIKFLFYLCYTTLFKKHIIIYSTLIRNYQIKNRKEFPMADIDFL